MPTFRSREEIKSEEVRSDKYTEARMQSLILETLLDIRDLLTPAYKMPPSPEAVKTVQEAAGQLLRDLYHPLLPRDSAETNTP